MDAYKDSEFYVTMSEAKDMQWTAGAIGAVIGFLLGAFTLSLYFALPATWNIQ